MLEYIPTVIQVIPYEDYTVDVYFDDGKIVKCMVLNGTLAWDVAGGRNVKECIDIDPLYLHELEKSKERIA